MKTSIVYNYTQFGMTFITTMTHMLPDTHGVTTAKSSVYFLKQNVNI